MIQQIRKSLLPLHADGNCFFSEIHKHVSCCPMFLIISILQPIKRALDKRTVEVYTLFNDELNAVKKELTSKGSPLPFNHPKFAGNAQWCRLLKKRIEREMMILDRAHFLPHMGEKFFLWLFMFTRSPDARKSFFQNFAKEISI